VVHPEWDQAQVDAEVTRIYNEIGFDLANRARVMLSEPATSTDNLTQEAQQLADTVRARRSTPNCLATRTRQGADMARGGSKAKRTTIRAADRKPVSFKPGGLHASLDVPAGQKIPAAKMAAAKAGKFGTKAKQQANLATGMLAAGRRTAAKNRAKRGGRRAAGKGK
jgi:hypothetical protein